MTKQIQDRPLGGGIEQDSSEPLRNVSGPTFGLRPTIDPLQWGKANRYLSDLFTYSGPDSLSDRHTFPEQSTADIRTHFMQMEMRDSEMVGTTKDYMSVDICPDWKEVLRVNREVHSALSFGRTMLEVLATEIAGIRDICTTQAHPQSGSGFRYEYVDYGNPVYNVLSAQFARALKAGVVSMEYDGSYEEAAKKNAETLIGEYPLYVQFFGSTVQKMLQQLPDVLEQDQRAFVEAISTLKNLPPKTLAYLAKIESFVPRRTSRSHD